jgi:hypothetical protein
VEVEPGLTAYILIFYPSVILLLNHAAAHAACAMNYTYPKFSADREVRMTGLARRLSRGLRISDHRQALDK